MSTSPSSAAKPVVTPAAKSAPQSPVKAEAAARSRGSAAPALILATTERLLLEGGIDAVSIRRVADGSGYSAPTIYHHFGDKRGLIDALLEERFSVVHQLMAAIPPEPDPAVYLRNAVSEFIRFALENPDHYRLLATPLESEPNVPSADAARELVRSALEVLADEGTLATRDAEAAFQVIWAVLHGLISLRLGNPTYEFVENLTPIALDMIEDGLLRRNRR